VFPKSRNNLCAWHVKQHLNKKFSFLNRGNDKTKKKLYKEIVELPLSENADDFDESFRYIMESDILSDEQIEYLKNKTKTKKFWVKAFMKTNLCCGTCTTSRIESKHRLLKRYLNAATQLPSLFQVWKQLEDNEITKYKDEIESFKKKEEEKLLKCELIQYFHNYSDYALNKLKEQLIQSTNYKLNKKTKGAW